MVPQCADVRESIDSQLVQWRQLERKYILEVIKCLRYLSRQGIPLGGIHKVRTQLGGVGVDQKRTGAYKGRGVSKASSRYAVRLSLSYFFL